MACRHSLHALRSIVRFEGFGISVCHTSLLKPALRLSESTRHDHTLSWAVFGFSLTGDGPIDAT